MEMFFAFFRKNFNTNFTKKISKKVLSKKFLLSISEHRLITHANIIPAISIVWLLPLHNFCSDETLTFSFLIWHVVF